MLCLSCMAQIPNNGFELWTSVNGYQNPTSWANLNEVTKSYSVFTCGKLSPGNPGSSYLSVRTMSVAGKGLVPGRVVSGKIDTVTYKPISGYPFVNRPLSLSYNIQYMVALPTDTAFVSVTLSKWNVNLSKRDTIAFGISRFNAMAHTWFSNSTSLNYVSGDNPDSACIVISSSSNVPLNTSFMYVDNLQFNGNVIGINEISEALNNISVFPNPAQDLVTININQSLISTININIYNSSGKLIFSKTIKDNELTISTHDWSKGLYSIIINENIKEAKQIIIN